MRGRNPFVSTALISCDIFKECSRLYIKILFYFYPQPAWKVTDRYSRCTCFHLYTLAGWQPLL